MFKQLTDLGFAKIHGCGCSGGESTWKSINYKLILRFRNIPKIIEIRTDGRNGNIVKKFNFDQIQNAIEYVKNN